MKTRATFDASPIRVPTGRRPVRVFVDADGNVITKDGRSIVSEDPAGDGFPWAPKPFSELFGDSFINNKGDIGKTLKEMGNSSTVKNMLIAAGVAGVTSYTDSWGRTLTDKGNTIVTDWAKRSQAYMLNTAAKGVLTLMLLAATLDLATSPLLSGLYAMGHAIKTLRITMVSTAVYLLMFVLLTRQFGLIGAGLAATVGAALTLTGMVVLMRRNKRAA